MSITSEQEVRDIFGKIMQPLVDHYEDDGSIFGSVIAPHMGQMYSGDNHNDHDDPEPLLSDFISNASILAPGPALPTQRPSKEDASAGFFADGDFAADSFVNRCFYLSNQDINQDDQELDEDIPHDENSFPQSSIPSKQEKPVRLAAPIIKSREIGHEISPQESPRSEILPDLKPIDAYSPVKAPKKRSKWLCFSR